MNFTKVIAAGVVGCGLMAGASTASAGDYNGDFMVRLQGTYLYTDDDMGRVTDSVAGDLTGTFAAAGIESYTTNSVLPTLTLTYFFFKNIAAELFCCFAKSAVKLDTPAGSAPVGDTWMFPPIVTLQYHFDKIGGFKPYVGAGVQYIHFFSEDADAAGTTMNVDNAFGFALQAGFDLEIGNGWYLNADVKKSFLDTTVTLNDGASITQVEHDLDPWIFSVGVGYRFNLFGPRYIEPLK